MSSENLAIFTVNAPPKQKLAIQSERQLPPDVIDLEHMVAHLAQFQARQFLLNLAGVLADEANRVAGLHLQVQPSDGAQVELLSSSGGLPEIWRIEGQTATIQHRQPDGQLQVVERSAF